MEKSKFKVGDRVLCTDSGKYGNINTIDDTDDYGEIWYGVLFDDGEEAWLEDEYLELTDVDKKTAFLHDLKMLLEKYDARFGDCEGYSVWFQIGDDCISWGTPVGGVGAEDVFDYNKD